MVKVTLGNTGITVNKNGFGVLPLQRVPMEDAVKILRRAYENGIEFFDTAIAYTDSQAKIGAALRDVRENIFIATKSGAATASALEEDIDKCLLALKTDYIDIFQIHNPAYCPLPGDEKGLYDVLIKAKEKGKIRHIGMSNHRIFVAEEALASGMYETIQFPFSYLSGDEELRLVEGCKEKNIGFIAMKSLAGGLLTNAAVAYAFTAKFENVLPIWGIQRETELDDFIRFNDFPPSMNEEYAKIIEDDRAFLVGQFCRGCGYCMPCPVGIQIRDCARMTLALRRYPTAPWLTEQWQKEMDKIEDCLNCGACKSKCPYGLDTPNLLKANLKDYREVLGGKPLFPFVQK